MTTTLRKPNGEFNGSIGDGRDTVPVATMLRTLADNVEAGMPAGALKSALAVLRLDEAAQYDDTAYTRVTRTIDGHDLEMTEEQAEALEAGDTVLAAQMNSAGHLCVVTYDEYPQSPREWTDPAFPLTGLDEYLPDEAGLARSSNFMDDVVTKYGQDVRLVPVYVMDHSGRSYSTGAAIRPGDKVLSGAEATGDRWDTSMAGFAILPAATVKEQFGDLSEKSWADAVSAAAEEVSLYGQWAEGDVYRLDVYDSNGDLVWAESTHFSVSNALESGDPRNYGA